MRRPHRTRLSVSLALVLVAGATLALSELPYAMTADAQVAVPGQPGRKKTEAKERALRRAYDGAPPVIPHGPVGADCTECHNARGIEVKGLGFAPPTPHANTVGLSAIARCQQCHVYTNTSMEFRENDYLGFPQDLREGKRLFPGAPPVLPHRIFMRENCLACHSGPAAREEIRTSHPERTRCTQCHVEQTTGTTFP